MDFRFSKFSTEVGLHGGWRITGLVKKQNNKYGLFKQTLVHPIQITQEIPSRHKPIHTLIQTYSDGNIEQVTTSFSSFIAFELTEKKSIKELSPFAIEKISLSRCHT